MKKIKEKYKTKKTQHLRTSPLPYHCSLSSAPKQQAKISFINHCNSAFPLQRCYHLQSVNPVIHHVAHHCYVRNNSVAGIFIQVVLFLCLGQVYHCVSKCTYVLCKLHVYECVHVCACICMGACMHMLCWDACSYV